MMPITCILFSIAVKDQSRLLCLPILISNLIFGFMMVFLSLYIIIYVLIYSQNTYLRWCFLGNVGAITLGIIVNQFYRKCFDKRDVLKDTDDQDGDGKEDEQ